MAGDLRTGDGAEILVLCTPIWQADAGWVGEAGPGPSYLDPDRAPPRTTSPTATPNTARAVARAACCARIALPGPRPRGRIVTCRKLVRCRRSATQPPQ